jgi:hypothetical protein
VGQGFSPAESVVNAVAASVASVASALLIAS